MWSPNELLKTEKQRDILSYITLQFFPFKKVPLEHYPLYNLLFLYQPLAAPAGGFFREKIQKLPGSCPGDCRCEPVY